LWWTWTGHSVHETAAVAGLRGAQEVAALMSAEYQENVLALDEWLGKASQAELGKCPADVMASVCAVMAYAAETAPGLLSAGDIGAAAELIRRCEALLDPFVFRFAGQIPPVFRLRAMHAAALLHLRRGRGADALSVLNATAGLPGMAKDGEAAAVALLHRGCVQSAHSRADVALECAETAFRILKKTPTLEGEDDVMGTGSPGSPEIAKPRHSETLSGLDPDAELLPIPSALKADLLVVALHNSAVAQIHAGQYAAALHSTRQAVRWAELPSGRLAESVLAVRTITQTQQVAAALLERQHSMAPTNLLGGVGRSGRSSHGGREAEPTLTARPATSLRTASRARPLSTANTTAALRATWDGGALPDTTRQQTAQPAGRQSQTSTGSPLGTPGHQRRVQTAMKAAQESGWRPPTALHADQSPTRGVHSPPPTQGSEGGVTVGGEIKGPVTPEATPRGAEREERARRTYTATRVSRSAPHEPPNKPTSPTSPSRGLVPAVDMLEAEESFTDDDVDSEAEEIAEAKWHRDNEVVRGWERDEVDRNTWTDAAHRAASPPRCYSPMSRATTANDVQAVRRRLYDALAAGSPKPPKRRDNVVMSKTAPSPWTRVGDAAFGVKTDTALLLKSIEDLERLPHLLPTGAHPHLEKHHKHGKSAGNIPSPFRAGNATVKGRAVGLRKLDQRKRLAASVLSEVRYNTVRSPRHTGDMSPPHVMKRAVSAPPRHFDEDDDEEIDEEEERLPRSLKYLAKYCWDGDKPSNV